LKIYSVKRKTIPKIAVLATGLAVAILAATIHPTPAQAYSSNPPLSSCAGCHSGGVITAGTTATAPTTPLAPGASYSVTVTPVANPAGGMSGYAIVPVAPATGSTNGTGTSLSYTATMIAPASAGTFTYTVWTNQGPDGAGVVGTATYNITVAPVVTIPPTTIPPTTIPPTTIPPTTIPPTTVPPTTIPPTTVPPTTVPPTTVPPVMTTAHIQKLSPKHGVIGTILTIRGTGFGTLGAVQFGTVVTTATSWTDTEIVFSVPAGDYRKVAALSVIPAGNTASNAVHFRFDKVKRHHSFADDPSFRDYHSFGDIDSFKAIAGHRALFEGSDD
jgi:IPT/TIG domain